MAQVPSAQIINAHKLNSDSLQQEVDLQFQQLGNRNSPKRHKASSKLKSSNVLLNSLLFNMNRKKTILDP